MKWVIFNFFTVMCFHSTSVKSQHGYSGNTVLDCNTNHDLHYTCNGRHPSCHSFLIFKSRPPYDSVPNIAALMSSNPSDIAQINNVTTTAAFPRDKEVIVPVNCSCSGDRYYQANTSFHVAPEASTYFVVANLTFQGLAACGSLKHANRYGELELEAGLELRVPLRCACPTKRQISSGTVYLLTYSISFDDNVNDLARRFNVSAESVLKANRFSEANPTLFPFTTILIPLPTGPLSSQTIIQRYTPTKSVPFPSTVVSSAKKSKVSRSFKVGMAAVGCSFVVFTALVVTVLVAVLHRRGDRAPKREEMTEGEKYPEDLLVKIASFEQILKVFSFAELQKATGNFASERRIKGCVYRGVLGNQIVAVKKVGVDVSKQVNMLSKINHFNLLKLYGFCKHQDSCYLVFEYMTMGSLREWLRGQRSEEARSLSRRIQIAVDVAYGLQYLHNFAKPGYVHRNIKSSNILFDSNLRAKISNFTFARTTDYNGDDIDALTSTVVGTRGYVAPEYVEGNGSATLKVDVYSFGVVMLELISGKDAVLRQGNQEVLLSTAVAAIMEGANAEAELRSMAGLVNEEEDGSMECAVQMVKLSLTCLRRDPASRPSMEEVVSSLVKIQVDLQSAVERRRRREVAEADPCIHHCR